MLVPSLGHTNCSRAGMPQKYHLHRFEKKRTFAKARHISPRRIRLLLFCRIYPQTRQSFISNLAHTIKQGIRLPDAVVLPYQFGITQGKDWPMAARATFGKEMAPSLQSVGQTRQRPIICSGLVVHVSHWHRSLTFRIIGLRGFCW